ncbi:MAG: hypothetical protein U0L05_07485 [Schaedlerella sp.]|nr:hypothetical protein [Schaedlerella sp.]
MLKKYSCKTLSLLLVFAMFCSSLLAGCKKNHEEISAENLEDTAVYEFDGILVTDLENVYECNLEMGQGMSMKLYLRIDADGNFVFLRNTDFSSTEKGAGKVYERKNGEHCLVYYIVNGEEVELGEYISTFEITEDGKIAFTSSFWFGATEPKLTSEDGAEDYLEFIVSKEL